MMKKKILLHLSFFQIFRSKMWVLSNSFKPFKKLPSCFNNCGLDCTRPDILKTRISSKIFLLQEISLKLASLYDTGTLQIWTFSSQDLRQTWKKSFNSYFKFYRSAFLVNSTKLNISTNSTMYTDCQKL